MLGTLATVKPGYFGRFGFKAFSRWKLPTSVLLYKLGQVFQQPLRRWGPAILGKFIFMEKQCGNSCRTITRASKTWRKRIAGLKVTGTAPRVQFTLLHNECKTSWIYLD